MQEIFFGKIDFLQLLPNQCQKYGVFYCKKFFGIIIHTFPPLSTKGDNDLVTLYVPYFYEEVQKKRVCAIPYTTRDSGAGDPSEPKEHVTTTKA